MQELTRTQAHKNMLITKIVEIEIRFLRTTSLHELQDKCNLQFGTRSFGRLIPF